MLNNVSINGSVKGLPCLLVGLRAWPGLAVRRESLSLRRKKTGTCLRGGGGRILRGRPDDIGTHRKYLGYLGEK